MLIAAVGLLDAEGPAALTMRRLGRALGVEAMSLYRHFPSRSALLDGIVEHLISGLEADPAMQWAADDDWTDYLQRLAHGVRAVALAHPRVFPLVVSRPAAAPWIRPPLRSLRWIDGFLAGLQDHDFPPPAAVTVYKQFTAVLLGHLLLEISALGLDHPPSTSAPPGPPDTDQAAAQQQRSEAAADAEQAMTGPDAPTAEQIEERSTGRTDTVADEPGVLAAAPDIAATGSSPVHGEGGLDSVRAELDLPVVSAVADASHISLTDYPHVVAYAGLLATDTAAADFDRLLGFLLTDLAPLRAS